MLYIYIYSAQINNLYVVMLCNVWIFRCISIKSIFVKTQIDEIKNCIDHVHYKFLSNAIKKISIILIRNIKYQNKVFLKKYIL